MHALLRNTAGVTAIINCTAALPVMLAIAGGYFQSSGADPSIKLRLKEDYDGAEPAPSSIAAGNLLRLAALLPQGGEHAHAHACGFCFTGCMSLKIIVSLAAAGLRNEGT
eukprot:GHRQ01034547.1.p1 GENE.GHRQ01034547.1~~GHRQ01034547.1.p1  ORF type:complete len:110 (-),score=26.35 GHRQ01034547.1:106-435(-)